MEERQRLLSSMVWRRFQPYFCVLLIPQNSMFSNFCHVVLKSLPQKSDMTGGCHKKMRTKNTGVRYKITIFPKVKDNLK